jgi:CRP-like cAMP-binding protein
MSASAESELSQHPVFHDLPAEDIRLIARLTSTRQYTAQQLVFKQDRVADHFYLVHSGNVAVEVPSISGEPLTIQTLGPGSVLGWSWLVPPYRWLFNARATVATSLFAVNGEELREACERDPALGYRVLKRFAALMAERLNAARTTAMKHYAGG